MTAKEWQEYACKQVGFDKTTIEWFSEQCERLEKDCACKDQEIAALKADLAECIASYSLHNP